SWGIGFDKFWNSSGLVSPFQDATGMGFKGVLNIPPANNPAPFTPMQFELIQPSDPSKPAFVTVSMASPSNQRKLDDSLVGQWYTSSTIWINQTWINQNAEYVDIWLVNTWAATHLAGLHPGIGSLLGQG